MADLLHKFEIYLDDYVYTKSGYRWMTVSGHFVVTKDGETTLRYASYGHYDGSENWFHGAIIELPYISSQRADYWWGVEQWDEVEVVLSPLKDDPTNSMFVLWAANEFRGRWAKLTKTFDGSDYVKVGKISHVSVGEQVRVYLEQRDDEVFRKLIPPDLINTNDWPDAPGYDGNDIGKPVNICFGHCINVPLRHVQNDTDNDYYDYLVCYNTIEGIWDDAENGYGVKRDGILVPASEYTLYTDGANSTCYIRFSLEQRDAYGRFYRLTADVKGMKLGGGSAERNRAICLYNLLINSTWGLNDSADSTSFTTAAGILNGIGSMNCDGAITEQREAQDYVTDLLRISRASIFRGTDYQWEIDIDVIKTSSGTFGQNDGYWNNIISSGDLDTVPKDQAAGKIVLQYGQSRTEGERQKELAVRTGFGVDKVITSNFVLYHADADKILVYERQKALYAEKSFSIIVGKEGAGIAKGDMITVIVPHKGIASPGSKWTTERVEDFGNGEFEFILSSYDDLIFDEEALSDPDDPPQASIVVSGPKSVIGAVSLGDGVSLPGSITLKLADTYGDTYVASEGKSFDNLTTGFIFGVDDTDDKAKMYVGGSSKYLNWDGTNWVWQAGNSSLDADGNLTCTGGTIGGCTITATMLHVLSQIGLDAGNKRFFIQTNTFGSAGVQLEYSSSVGKIYAGDGSTKFLKWDGTTLSCQNLQAASINATSGTFAGSLSAATGTFAGALSAATGTFAGSLSAATGTFSGTLSAASIASSAGLTVTAANGIVFNAGSIQIIPSGGNTYLEIASTTNPNLRVKDTTYGSLVFLYATDSFVSIGSGGTYPLRFAYNSTDVFELTNTNQVLPMNHNTGVLGAAARRWLAVHANGFTAGSTFALGSWTITLGLENELVFRYGGVTKFYITTGGHILAGEGYRQFNETDPYRWEH